MSNSEKFSKKVKAAKWLHLPVVRILLALLLVAITLVVCQKVQSLICRTFSIHGDTPKQFINLFLTIPAVHLVYVWYVRTVEKRIPIELSLADLPRFLSKGILIGVAYVACVIGIMWALDLYSVTGKNTWTVMLPVFAFALTTRYVEEIIARGIIFRIAEERLGSWLTAGLLTILFALLHLSQTGSTLIGALAVGAAAGFFMSTAHIMTRRLWTTIGIHATWYFSQVGIFGHPVAGHDSVGLLKGSFTGPELLSGGMFGAEFSVIAGIIGLCIAALFLLKAKKKGNIIVPIWNSEAD